MSFFGFFTEGHGWVYASLIATFISAFNALVNQYFKQPGGMLVLCSRLMIVLLLTPQMFNVTWPDKPEYYIAVALTAIIGGFADVRTLNCISKFGGGAVARVGPLTIFASFILWFFVDHALFFKYMGHPWRTVGICLTLAGCIYFSMRMRKNPISTDAMRSMAPALVAYTICGLLNKYSMRMDVDHEGAVFCYMYVQSLIIIPMVAVFLLFTERRIKAFSLRRELFNKNLAKAGIFSAILWIGAVSFMNIAMITIPSPAYYGAINQLSPVIISIIYLLVKHKEQGDVKSGFGVVACAIAMSFLVV